MKLSSCRSDSDADISSDEDCFERQDLSLIKVDERQPSSREIEIIDKISLFENLMQIWSVPEQVKIVKKLPLSDKRITFIFDLDETLIHSEEVAYSGQESLNFTVSIRPYAVECLETAS